MKNPKMKRDILLVAAVLILAAGFFLAGRLAGRKPAVIVEIAVDGQVVKELDLSQNIEFVIEGYQGGTNTLIIQDGAAYVTDASCPDKICIHQGKISHSGEMIVCLPNRMIAKIVGDD